MNDSEPKKDPGKKSNAYKIQRVVSLLKSNFKIRYNIIKNDCEVYDHKLDQWYIVDDKKLFTFINLHGADVGIDLIRNCLHGDLFEEVNPIKDYIEKCEYQGNGFIEKMASYVTAVDQDFWTLHFKKHLVRMIKQVMDTPYYFNKHALILHSEKQHLGKSTFIKSLIPKHLQNYYAEGQIKPDDKDQLRQMAECFIYNLEELGNMGKHNLNQIKALFSMTSFNSRLPYSRNIITLNRYSSFWGSTNDTSILTDSENVRWIIVPIEAINHSYYDWKTKKIEVPIDQLWAEAYMLYLSEFDSELSSDELAQNEINNIDFVDITPGEEIIQRHFDPKEEVYSDKMTSSEIYDYLASKEKSFTNMMPNSTWMGRSLNKLGFKKVNRGVSKCYLVTKNEERLARENGTTSDEPMPF
jgi:predicted P-loop ATPase